MHRHLAPPRLPTWFTKAPDRLRSSEAFTHDEYPTSASRSTTGSPGPTSVPAWLDVALDLLLLAVVIALARLDVSDWIFLAGLAAGWWLVRRLRSVVTARRRGA